MNSTRNDPVLPVLTIITLCPILTIIFGSISLVLVYKRLVSSKAVSLMLLTLWALLAIYGALHLFAWKPVLHQAAPFFLRFIF